MVASTISWLDLAIQFVLPPAEWEGLVHLHTHTIICDCLLLEYPVHNRGRPLTERYTRVTLHPVQTLAVRGSFETLARLFATV